MLSRFISAIIIYLVFAFVENWCCCALKMRIAYIYIYTHVCFSPNFKLPCYYANHLHSSNLFTTYSYLPTFISVNVGLV